MYINGVKKVDIAKYLEIDRYDVIYLLKDMDKNIQLLLEQIPEKTLVDKHIFRRLLLITKSAINLQLSGFVATIVFHRSNMINPPTNNCWQKLMTTTGKR